MTGDRLREHLRPTHAAWRRHVALIRDSGDHLLTLINDILDLSKLAAGHLELEIAPFCPVAVARSAVELFSARAREKGLELMFLPDEELPTVVKGDASRIRQILINLIGNAVKFTPKVRVTVTLSASADGGLHRLRWDVADAGDRHSRRPASAPIQGLCAGRQFDLPAVRGHGARPCDLQAAL